jgi:methanogenic corrinoid protein MtbC1
VTEDNFVSGLEPRVLSMRERRAVANALRGAKRAMATRANDAFYAVHPEWTSQFGATGVQRGQEDAEFHIEFLAGALEAGAPDSFAAYVDWLLEVLRARGISANFVEESLQLVGEECMLVAGNDARSTIASLVHTGIERTRRTPTATLEGGAAALEWPFSSALEPFIQVLLRGERHGAVGVARESLRLANHPTDVYIGLFQRSLEEVGRRWQADVITVAQEHMATATVQFVLAQLYSSLQRSPIGRGNALITGVEGELHQVGANLVADSLEMDGWTVRFLGTNMPHEGIVAAAAEMKADLVGISATMLFNVDAVVRLIESIKAMPGSATPRVLVGGGAFRHAPELWREIGADGFAGDLQGACEVARMGKVIANH